MCTHMLAYLYHSGPHADFNTHVATVRGRLTLTAAFSGTQVKNVALDRKSTRLNSSHPSRSRMPSSA